MCSVTKRWTPNSGFKEVNSLFSSVLFRKVDKIVVKWQRDIKGNLTAAQNKIFKLSSRDLSGLITKYCVYVAIWPTNLSAIKVVSNPHYSIISKHTKRLRFLKRTFIVCTNSFKLYSNELRSVKIKLLVAKQIFLGICCSKAIGCTKPDRIYGSLKCKFDQNEGFLWDKTLVKPWKIKWKYKLPKLPNDILSLSVIESKISFKYNNTTLAHVKACPKPKFWFKYVFVIGMDEGDIIKVE